MSQFTVRVPATISNLGPGFDVLGFAIHKHLSVRVNKSGNSNTEHCSLKVNGQTIDLPTKENAVFQGMRRISARCSKELPYPDIEIVSEIPLKRGLGSSAAARVAGLIIGDRILGARFSNERIIEEAVNLEGHPDNVIPAYVGGLTICYAVDDSWQFVPMDIEEQLRVVVGVPDLQVETKKARTAMPKTISVRDAVFTNSRLSLLMTALYEKKYQLLAVAMQDRLHQPYRKEFIPGFDEIVERTVDEGAYGTAISGSGPSVFSFVEEQLAERIGNLMVDIWSSRGVNAAYFVTTSCKQGARIIE